MSADRNPAPGGNHLAVTCPLPPGGRITYGTDRISECCSGSCRASPISGHRASPCDRTASRVDTTGPIGFAVGPNDPLLAWSLHHTEASRPNRSRYPCPMRPSWIEVDLDAIESNVREIGRAIQPAAVCAVVKADGYGHGAVPVAEAAIAGGATLLAVALVSEGVN